MSSTIADQENKYICPFLDWVG